jgi:DNA-binding transcriptional LysR family regulator
LIGYSATTYFGRCLNLLLQRASKKAALTPHFESDMADVLKKLALNGEGIAWLPRSLIEAELTDGTLVPSGDRTWQLDLQLRLYRDRSNEMPLLKDLWAYLESQNAQASRTEA